MMILSSAFHDDVASAVHSHAANQGITVSAVLREAVTMYLRTHQVPVTPAPSPTHQPGPEPEPEPDIIAADWLANNKRMNP